jgi:hypothetical protein
MRCAATIWELSIDAQLRAADATLSAIHDGARAIAP